eukprot:GFUD01037928.1.p1 GENE.GFUD01037928.1~~GFUD01037928.1.p1  ORF type:complete len:1087 (-),score=203.66 GFUD01037928.1:753-4013(-)
MPKNREKSGSRSTKTNATQDVQLQKTSNALSPDTSGISGFVRNLSGRSFGNRHIKLNALQDAQLSKLSNSISTTKYSLITFLPRYLYEQFRKYWNVYFLVIGLMQQIPDVSPTGRWNTILPLTFILMMTALKELFEDLHRRREDNRINNKKVQVLKGNQWKKTAWSALKVGDIVRVENKEPFPADLILLSSSESTGICYIETSNLDGETNLKVRQSLTITAKVIGNLGAPDKIAKIKGGIECEQPNKKLYDFTGSLNLDEGEKAPLSTAQLLLRGSKLMNTTFIVGTVVYSGHESKLMKNSQKVPLKDSTIQKMTNIQIIFLFLMLLCIGLFAAFFAYLQREELKNESLWYLVLKKDTFIWNFVTYVILLNNLIPISLQFTLEFVKLGQAMFINWDKEMRYPKDETLPGTFAEARTSNLNEELGQIKYVFSDKTGTLTQNIMLFRFCAINGKKYSENDKELLRKASATDPHVEECLRILSVCHTVIPDKDDSGKVEYNASSPDEKAFVDAARDYGFEFIGRTPELVKFKTWDDNILEYTVLALIEFTSSRKRMSALIKTEKGEIKLYTKGADSVILERVAKNGQEKVLSKAQEQIDEFARDGLRTMALGMRDIPQNEFDDWHKEWRKASVQIKDRDEALDKAAIMIEKDLVLVGITAIEDKLQDYVPETIANLLEAQIHVWVLTGDKQETAINIGRSCKMITDDMCPLIQINADKVEDAEKIIMADLEKFQKAETVGKDNNKAVIIDGKTLGLVYEDPGVKNKFLELGTSCKSVICCRVSPSQKAEVVRSVKTFTHGAITLAIGDGANDVAMIQSARVGVGISGNEGLQAANSADFSIAQFSFLQRLLFVHGAWNYSRISKVLLWSFYKNITLYLVNLWYSIYCMWSGQPIYSTLTITLFNIIFTFFPAFAIGLLDRPRTSDERMTKPGLYYCSQNGMGYNKNVFWRWIVQAILHSVILFWIPMWSMGTGVNNRHGYSEGYLELGNTIYTAVVITTVVKTGLEKATWTFLCFVQIFGSILLWTIFLWAYSYFTLANIPGGNANMLNMAFILSENFGFWFSTFVASSLTIGTDIAFKVIENLKVKVA